MIKFDSHISAVAVEMPEALQTLLDHYFHPHT